MRPRLRTSVGRRLILLVLSQTVIAALLIFLALGAFDKTADEVRYIYEFQLLAIAETGKAIKNAVDLQRVTTSAAETDSDPEPATISALVSQLEAFRDRYSVLWQAAHGNTPDAARFRRDLMRTGDEGTLQGEASALKRVERSLRALVENSVDSTANSPKQRLLENARNVEKDLYVLHDVNVRYAELMYQHIVARAKTVRNWLLAVGVLGASLTLFLGLHVHRAIAPRVKRLVDKVQRFREFGVNEKVIESGQDEIAILANALDAGFSAIDAREREREEFMAVAAHELKTPITSIHGYSKLLLDHPERTFIVHRALKIIHRQSWRLSRLVEDLFLAMRARVGQLRFHPKPLDLSALVQRVLSEVRALISDEMFKVHCKPNVMILGDEALLEHALWSLFTSASTLSPDLPVKVVLDTADLYARLRVDVQSSECSARDAETLFTPFQSVQYESGSGIRAGVGLYLCREIVRLHGGRLRIDDLPNVGPQFSMELSL